MPQTITLEVLSPWLSAHGVTEAQLSAVNSWLDDLSGTKFEPGTAGLLHRDTVVWALEAIDGVETKWDEPGDGPVQFREWLTRELTATGILYWLIGADILLPKMEAK